MSAAVLAPSAVELHPDRLRLQWTDGVAEIGAATLRAACRCAGCRAVALNGPSPSPEPSAPLCLTGAAPVGFYALQLQFSDGHQRGIYPWSLLRELPRDSAEAPSNPSSLFQPRVNSPFGEGDRCDSSAT
jgi:DUF971 family protein